ncbi:hypothetical protein [Kitasatospora sp. NPDC018619]|uniref:hypothetical protein n=1 Tax=unclassified Kitasatospora TaxID=2633591 RepID=UPI0037B5A2FA
MSAPPLDAARAWLATGTPDPAHAYRWWEHNPDGVAIMPMGRLFDAVEIRPPLSASIRPGAPLVGPTFAYAQQVYVLVPAGTADVWTSPLARCLGDGHYLSIPDPSRCDPVGAYWITAPDGTGAVTDPDMLLGVIVEAAARHGEAVGE